MDGTYSPAFERALDAEVEIRHIDTDEHIRRRIEKVLDKSAAKPAQRRITAQYFHQPHDGKLVNSRDLAATGRDHERSVLDEAVRVDEILDVLARGALPGLPAPLHGLGTASVSGGRRIGSMPDLKAILEDGLGLNAPCA